MTAYQLDPADRLQGGAWAIPAPWCYRLTVGRTYNIEIAGRVALVKITTVRTHYAIAHEVQP